MKLSDINIDDLRAIRINSISQGKEFANEILTEQIRIHKLMVGEYDNERWQSLCTRHFELRKVRQSVLNAVNSIAAAKIKSRRQHSPQVD